MRETLTEVARLALATKKEDGAAKVRKEEEVEDEGGKRGEARLVRDDMPKRPAKTRLDLERRAKYPSREEDPEMRQSPLARVLVSVVNERPPSDEYEAVSENKISSPVSDESIRREGQAGTNIGEVSSTEPNTQRCLLTSYTNDIRERVEGELAYVAVTESTTRMR